MRFLVIGVVCCLTLLGQSSILSASRDIWDEDGMWDGDNGPEAFKPFYPHLEEFSELLLEAFGATAEQKQEIRNAFADETIPPNPDCNLCRGIYLTIHLIVNVLERDFEEAKERIIPVCIVVLTESEDLRGDIMCPGVVNTYGPSIWTIWQNSPMSAQEVCEFYNQCDIDQPILDPGRDPILPPFPFGGVPDAEAREKALERHRNLPQLKGRVRGDLSNTIKVAQVADIHVEELYVEGSPTDCGLPVCCRDDASGEGSAGHWGNFGCNVPKRTTESLMAYLNDLQPEMLLYVGDSCPHTVWDETIESQLDVSRYVAALFERKLPGIPTYSTVGNHETYPTSFFDPQNAHGQEILKEWGKVFGPLADFSQQQYNTLHDAGYYTILTKLPKLRILGYNSNYGYNSNGYNILNKGSDHYKRMMDFMENTLAAARSAGEKVILVGHHPTGQQSSHVPHARLIVDLQIKYSDIIVLHPQGHHHDDDFRLLVDPDSGRAVGVQHSGPTLNTRNIHNPAMRIIYLDKDTYLPVDMDVYLLDVGQARLTKSTEPPIRHQYRFTEEYDVDDMTVRSLEKVGCRLEKDPDLVQRFFFNMKNEARNDCGSNCERRVKCTVWQSNWHDNNRCRLLSEYPISCRVPDEEKTTTPAKPETTTKHPEEVGGAKTTLPLSAITLLIIAFLAML